MLDVDAKLPKNGGDEQVLSGIAALALLEERHGVLPPTLTASTGGGGRHLFFRWDESRPVRNSQKLKGPSGQKTSLDVRGDGGYVVLAPSHHASGATYQWLNEDPPAEAPDWLLDLVTKEAAPVQVLFDPMAHGDGPVSEEERKRRYGAGVLDGACKRIASAPEGTRHDTLNREAFIVGQWIEDTGLSPEWARSALEQAGRMAGKPPKETRDTVADALTKGMAAEPRRVPPTTRPIQVTHTEDQVVEISEARSRKDILRRLHRTADKRDRATDEIILGLPKPTLENAVRILREDPMFARRLAYNRFTAKVLLDDVEVTDANLVQLRYDIDRLYRCGLKHEMADHAVELVARDNSFDPLLDYLNGLEWDGVERIRTWLSRYLGAPDTSLHEVYGVRWLIAAIIRAFRPGEKEELVLTLTGAQYAGKSRAFRILAVRDDWFLDEAFDMRKGDAGMFLEGRWIVELGELASLKKADADLVKNFLSKQQDVLRRPYGRKVETVQRRCAFAGTTNASRFLNDSSGARRFAVVPVADRIDLDGLERDRDQLWAEALSAWRSGNHGHLTYEEIALQSAENETYELEDPWVDLIDAWVSALPPFQRDRLSSHELLTKALELDARSLSHSSKIRLGYAMQKLGYMNKRMRDDGSLTRLFVRVTP